MSYSSMHNGSTSASALLNQSHFLSFSVPQQPSFSARSIPYQPPNFPSSSTSNTAPHPFKAPAHKHAHHLHSIPPREKSTRTLIIDHMLWVHGRTRFTQARAELGMTDRTGGSSSPNYRHRERPESYDEDDEVSSDGENVEILKAREGGPGHPHNDDEDNRRQKQDLTLARSLRLRAIGLEKVVTSMLDQPPPVHPIFDDDPTTPPTSPKRPDSLQSPLQRHNSHPHTLPNGVRLRLALGTVINDLFARQAPPPPYRHHHHPPPIIVSSNGSDQASSSGLTPGNSPAIRRASPVSGRGSSISSAPGAIGSLPPSVVLLSQVSAAALPQTTLFPRGDFHSPTSPMQAPNPVPSRVSTCPEISGFIVDGLLLRTEGRSSCPTAVYMLCTCRAPILRLPIHLPACVAHVTSILHAKYVSQPNNLSKRQAGRVEHAHRLRQLPGALETGKVVQPTLIEVWVVVEVVSMAGKMAPALGLG